MDKEYTWCPNLKDLKDKLDKIQNSNLKPRTWEEVEELTCSNKTAQGGD